MSGKLKKVVMFIRLSILLPLSRPFTLKSKARIGIISNNENNCKSYDSRIGFGTGGEPDHSTSCGNEATAAPDNGSKHIKRRRYVLVQ